MKKLIFLTQTLLLFLVPQRAQAQGSVTIPIEEQLTNQGATTDLGGIITSIINVAITLAGVITLLFLVWGAYDWLMSGGDKAKVEMARGKITNAIIGLGLVAAAYAIYRILDTFFGIGITNEALLLIFSSNLA